MIERTGRAMLVCLLVTGLAVPALPTMACGPDFSPPVFIESERADAPPDAYAAGQLGIVLPSYVQSYLVIAYRYFSGKPLDAEEQRQFVALWNRYQGNGDQSQDNGADTSDWNSAWHEWEQNAKVNVPNMPRRDAAAGNGMAKLPQMYESYGNCLTDAYATAANTLRAREQEFGPSSPAVQSWIQAQFTVFENCSTPRAGTPDEAQSDLPQEIRKDREYQIAAAHFYAGDWDEAEKGFLAISADRSSPWRATAGLVAARCEIRKGTLGTDDPDARDTAFTTADLQLKKIIADPAFASVRTGAESLRGFVEFRSQPGERAVELSNLLERGVSTDKFAQNIDDYTKLMRQESGTFRKDPALQATSEMTDWILSFTPGGAKDDEARIVTRWQTTHSLPWLVAALTYAQQDTPQLIGLLDSAAKVPADSAAYLTVTFQRDRVLAVTGKQTQARQEIDKVLAMQKDRVPASSRNLFLALRMKLAQNLDEFLRYAPRMAAEAASDFWGEGQVGAEIPMFDDDAAEAFTETIPLNVLAASARSTILPKSLRKDVAIAAWTRAVISYDDAAGQTLSPIVTALAPELKANFAPYDSAQSPEDRAFAAVFILLHTPGLQPTVLAGLGRFGPSGMEGPLTTSSYGGNWWCSMTPARSGQRYYDNYNPKLKGPLLEVYKDGMVSSPGFLNAAERGDAAKEWTAFSAVPAGPDWLIQQTLLWAKTHPQDPRVPEALHFGVRATRHGCNDAETGVFSKQAFTLLHSRFPKSEWAKQTPYWFK